jgi:polyhydroxybutyrate depolymerase
MKHLYLFLATLFCLTTSQHQAQTTLVETFDHDGLTRDYILYLPANIQPGAALVFNLHGYTEGAAIHSIYSEMNDVADDNGFAVCYPEGTVDGFGFTHWNSGLLDDPADDIGFLTSLAEALQVEHSLDPERTFSCGISNGGMMSYHLACNAPDTFKAVASVAGSMTTETYNNCDSGPAVPIFAIHGTLDLVVPYGGADIPIDGWGTFQSVSAVMSFWNAHNGCSNSVEGSLDNISLLDFSTVDTWKWSSCDGGNENWLYRVNGGGHNWPGAIPIIALGNTNQDFHASEEIWNFFAQCQSAVGVDELESRIQKVYPNPAHDMLCGLNGVYEIWSLSGGRVAVANANEECFDLPVLSPGIYIVKSGEGLSTAQRLFIQ